MVKEYIIRSAHPEEAHILSELALQSKAHWEYSPLFLEASRPDLTVTSDYIEGNVVFVLAVDDTIQGFYGMRELEDGAVDLEYLFVHPDAIGGGFGRKLWQHAVQTAKELGYHYIFIDSDPYAETFYEAMGARRIGHSESPVEPGRMLPLMRYSLG